MWAVRRAGPERGGVHSFQRGVTRGAATLSVAVKFGARGLLTLQRYRINGGCEVMTGAVNFLDATDTMLRVEHDTRVKIAETFAFDLPDET